MKKERGHVRVKKNRMETRPRGDRLLFLVCAGSGGVTGIRAPSRGVTVSLCDLK